MVEAESKTLEEKYLDQIEDALDKMDTVRKTMTITKKLVATYYPKRIEILRQSTMGVDTKTFNEEVNACVEIHERIGLLLHDIKIATESDGLVIVLIFDKTLDAPKESKLVCDTCEKHDCLSRGTEPYTYCSAKIPKCTLPSKMSVLNPNSPEPR